MRLTDPWRNMVPRQKWAVALASLAAGAVLTVAIAPPLDCWLKFVPGWRQVLLFPALSAFVMAAGLWLVMRQERIGRGASRWSAVLYALPSLIVWGANLCLFWPGFLSYDSCSVWSQALSGRYADMQPVLYSWSMKIGMVLGNSPGWAVLFYLLLHAAVAGYCLSTLQRLGMPAKVCAALSVIYALLPPNAILSITLWKDVPYTALLTLYATWLLQVVVSQGAWLRSWRNRLCLAAAGALIALFRQNGLIVAVAAPLVLLPAFRADWRGIITVWGGTVGIRWLVKALLYATLSVQPPQAMTYVISFLPAITAQVVSHTPLRESERALLSRVAPLDSASWGAYSPFAFDWVWFAPGMSWKQLPPQEVPRLWLTLLLRNPWVHFRHYVLSGSPVWSVNTLPTGYVMTFPAFCSDNGTVKTGVPNHPGMLEVETASPVTKRVAPLFWKTLHPRFEWWCWRSAAYLYLLLGAVVVACLRARNPRYLLVAGPVLLNSMTVWLFCVTQDFRYVYPTLSLALLVSPYLLFYVPRKSVSEADRAA
jgi:hypothetical protein